jgi:predicted DsbA family dithiol-disulfide isomerase
MDFLKIPVSFFIMKMKIGILMPCLLICCLLACSQQQTSKISEAQINLNTMSQDSLMPKMKVEIWSDIMCPFCYIGKRNFEGALSQFADSASIEVEWKSFQLDPSIPQHFDDKVNVYQYLADRKGMSLEQSKAMHERVVNMAKDAGLQYNFDKAVVANSFSAHRMIQFAKTKGLGDAAEERLFYAYFTEGKNFGDENVLKALGNDIGLTEADVKEALSNELYAARVKHDVMEADSIGVTGVPFFVFDRKFAVSGAQPSQAFLQALNQSYGEWKKNQPVSPLKVEEGPSCTPQGKCD